MFSVYAVILSQGEKNRFFLGHFPSLDEAKHVANCATCGNADYAYVKDGHDTVFFLRPPNPYEAGPKALLNPPRELPASEEWPHRKYRPFRDDPDQTVLGWHREPANS